MRRIVKNPNSQIILSHLQYSTVSHRRQIRQILEQEQQNFCAYTEDRIQPTLADDVEHFNPTLKDTPADGYNNWFAVSHRWNIIKKDEQWLNFQPIMHPTDPTLESRLYYYDGFYIFHPEDTEARNLIEFLNINDLSLYKERINYIKRLKFLRSTNLDLVNYLTNHTDDIRFRRALEAEFNITV